MALWTPATLRTNNLAGAAFEQVIAKHAHLSANEIVDALFRAAQEFASESEVFDDQTAVVLKVSYWHIDDGIP